MKRLLAFIVMTMLCCGGSGATTVGSQGVVSTPDSEFVTLSDMAAAMPVAANAGDAMAPLQGSGVHQETVGAAPVTTASVEAAATAVVTGITVSAMEPVKQEIRAGEGSNVVVSSDTSTELMPVASFTSVGERQNLISVALDDVPLQDVVRLFTRISGANIIASSTNLQGKVTVNLQDVEWKPALDSILDMYNLTVSEKVPGSKIYSVMAKVPGSEPLIAQPIFLNYAQVSNIVAVIQPMVGRDGMVSPFPNANALIVRATAANLSSIIKVVKEIDIPRQQVYIEAKFMELSDEAIKDLGVNWQVLEGYGIGAKSLSQTLNDSRNKVNSNHTSSDQSDSRKSSDAIQSGDSSTLADSTAKGLASSVDLSQGRNTSDSIDKTLNHKRGLVHNNDQTLSDVRTAVLSADDFRVVLSALQQINGITIVSNPKIIVANEETATIHIGENEPNIKGSVTAGQQGQANTTTYALDTVKPYFEFGISLEVTPTINNQSNISVRITPTLSRFVKDKTAPDGTTYPIEATKKIKTVFSLESGKTAAIGGLTETTDRDNVVKIPLLGDIPLLGKYFFSYTHKQHMQTETIIFVTVGLANPRTIQSEEGLPEETALTQPHLIVTKKLREQRLADAASAASKAKAASEKAGKTP
ncbi:MAG: secretin N-terminal domain-containing protein [bacterium]